MRKWYLNQYISMIVGKSTSNRSSAASFSSTKAIHPSSTTIARLGTPQHSNSGNGEWWKWIGSYWGSGSNQCYSTYSPSALVSFIWVSTCTAQIIHAEYENITVFQISIESCFQTSIILFDISLNLNYGFLLVL